MSIFVFSYTFLYGVMIEDANIVVFHPPPSADSRFPCIKQTGKTTMFKRSAESRRTTWRVICPLTKEKFQPVTDGNINRSIPQNRVKGLQYLLGKGNYSFFSLKRSKLLVNNEEVAGEYS